MIVRCENSSATYTTEFIGSLFNEEGKKSALWDSRTANLGVRRSIKIQKTIKKKRQGKEKKENRRCRKKNVNEYFQ